ncbi:RNA helicase Mov10l1 isoform X3 [Myripristis murdjan]|uniref:RNA helicase Mov10l1 isoform X3 n=1 Tax=Myripristis murdjan TaxID=586833 RepID=UPI001176159E|nr:RNA helicase Mov10l1 isoform X3 [Myripristis murdjan]
MLTTVRCVLSKLLSPLWSTVQVDEDVMWSCAADREKIRHLRGSVVTQLCLDYGMIDDTVYFTSAEVLGGLPLRVGDTVNCTAIQGGDQGGWKALRVEKSMNAWEDGGTTSLEEYRMQLRPLIGTVTSFDGESGLINQTTSFTLHSLWEGYVPMKGDWVQAKYFVTPTQWTTQAHSVAPLRYCRFDKVRVSSVYGQNGVVEDSVFFSLDSLLLPANYHPSPGDLVNVVMVESSQSFYCWRALCMAPCLQSANVAAAPLPETEIQSLLEDKGGLVVSDYGHFGSLLLKERRKLVFWIQNNGSETHRLKCCEFAGWDSEEQFTLGVAKEHTTLRQEEQSDSMSECAFGPSEENIHDAKEVDTENGEAQQETKHFPAVRTEQREADIAPGDKLSVVVGCQAKNLGSCAELLLLHFSSFTIGRRLEVTVGSKEESLLQPPTPYTPYTAQDTHTGPTTPAHVITVSAPAATPRLTKRRLPNFLGNYPVPQALRDCVEARGDVLVVEPCLGEVLSPTNMRSRFSSLLWLEELQAEKELREFTITGAPLSKGSSCLYLEVHGLTEGRPSLNIGDRITLKKPQSGGVVMEYIGYVTEIHDEQVSLRVNSEFQQSYLGEPLDVEFTYNRLTMRRCHYALDQAKQFGEILFPTKLTLQAPQWRGEWVEEPDQDKMEDNEVPAMENGEKVSSISIDMKSKATQTKDGKLPSKPIPCEGHFFNPDLNPPQREAVKRILSGECRPLPYVLFGPPGTGKTVTLIEAILQVYHFLPSSRVLVCTPSNSAADLICIRLHDSGFLHAASLARVNASCRQEEFIPEVLKQYSRAGEDIRHASFHRIVVSTCSSAGMFYNISLQVGHFTHVFLDEAGQATEPEALIPLSLVSERDGQIVLAGDPCQLGPVVKSKLASAFGLGLSLLERLMAGPLYSRKEWGYNPKLVTKLMYNYRSHEALLRLPSKLFYQGELCVRAPKAVVDSLCSWKHLPKKGFPLLFHGVRGTEMREGNNPSWFNSGEAVQVMLYCCQLAKKLYNPVDASDIGIIAPYRKQSEKIRVLLGRVGLSDIKVGSVEEFQGQEFLVIILSTSDDMQSVLGFLSNPKRFNVAITRPKALLIIVGNPHVLIKDPCFRNLLQYCFDNGAFMGCDPPVSLRAASHVGSNIVESAL